MDPLGFQHTLAECLASKHVGGAQGICYYEPNMDEHVDGCRLCDVSTGSRLGFLVQVDNKI
jgi:hypothetical protein